MAIFDLNQPTISLSKEDDVAVSNSLDAFVSSLSNTGYGSFASHDDNACSSNSLKTPKLMIHHEFIDTPDGSVYSVPKVSASVLPVLGTVNDNLEECIHMYRKYTSEADPNKNDRQVRSSNFRVCGCKARVVFDMVPHTSKYTLTTFDVEHNHELDKLFIIKATNANIGAVRAHNLYTGLKGSSSLVHGTQTEFKNFTRGVNCFIGDSNAQMLITRMEERQEFTKDFSFDYFIEDAKLCSLFWADEVANITTRSLVISYKMVFVPFTAIDNHRRFVTVGSGLLKKETAEAYGWLLRAFKKDFVRVPNIVVTDQDGAMRLAVADEFPKSKYRLCMWHIMQKIPSKIVWNMFIRPEEFEDRWNKLMEEFNLVNLKWLSKMCRLRSSWILAFFVDSPLFRLMRTTSTSESENSFFSYFTGSGSTLVKFMLCYESAMERQRCTHEKLDHQSFDSFPTLLTPLPIEGHAAKVYTRSLFIRVQTEIVARSWLCSIKAMSSDEGCNVCIIDEEKVKPVGTRKVLYNKGDGSVSCCCQLFVRSGILCRHIFCVFKNFKVSCIPDQHILRRWTRDLIPLHLRNKKNHYAEKNEAIEKLAIEASIIVDSCIHMLRNNEQKLSVFVNKMKALKSEVEVNLPIVPTRTVFFDLVQEFMGVKKPDKIKVKNPTGVRPKGRTDHNRRTCPGKNNADVLYSAVVVPGGGDPVDGGPQDGASVSVSV
ncbi:FAR1-related sequence 5-like protein [Tanacetum coccineum]